MKLPAVIAFFAATLAATPVPVRGNFPPKTGGGCSLEAPFVSAEWRAALDGRAVPVLSATEWRGEKAPDVDPGGNYGFLSFDWTAPATLEVTTSAAFARDLSTAAVRPAGAPVEVVSRGRDRLVLLVARPCTFSVEPNEYERPLFVFADPPARDVPDLASPRVKAFGPGVHRVPGDVVKLGSGETLYLARGAVLQAAVYGTGEDLRVCGRGILDGGRWARKKGPRYAFLHFQHAKRVTVEDVTVRGSWHWTVFPEDCDGVVLRNVKVCGGRCPNDDGIDPSNTRDVTIEDCFFRTQDDCIAVKGLQREHGDCARYRVRRCVFWSSFGRICLLGHESRAPRMHDFVLEDCDVLHYVRPVLLVEPGDDMRISDVAFRDVRVHMDDHGRSEATVRIQPVVNRYTKGPGSVRGVLLENIAFEGCPLPVRFLVRGVDAEHAVADVTFRGLTWNGRPLDASARSRVNGERGPAGAWFDGNDHPKPEDPAFKVGPFATGVTVDGTEVR